MKGTRTLNTQKVIDSPLGPLTLVNADGDLAGVFMVEHRHRPDPAGFGPITDAGFEQATEEFGEYFAGRRREFTVPTATLGTPFQRRVWNALRAIPYGETRTYGELAEHLGGRSLSRAVGAANGRNPLSVVVPCHRLIGSDGSLTDYGGGLARKRQLLLLEGALRPVPEHGPQ